MTGEVLLDTNIVIALLEREPRALGHFQSHEGRFVTQEKLEQQIAE